MVRRRKNSKVVRIDPDLDDMIIEKRRDLERVFGRASKLQAQRALVQEMREKKRKRRRSDFEI